MGSVKLYIKYNGMNLPYSMDFDYTMVSAKAGIDHQLAMAKHLKRTNVLSTSPR